MNVSFMCKHKKHKVATSENAKNDTITRTRQHYLLQHFFGFLLTGNQKVFPCLYDLSISIGISFWGNPKNYHFLAFNSPLIIK